MYKIWTGADGIKIIKEMFKQEFMKNVTGWVFTYNDFDKRWMAARREDASLLFNDIKNPKVIKSGSIDTLIYILRSTKGKPENFKG